jgi:hypothetical protein
MEAAGLVAAAVGLPAGLAAAKEETGSGVHNRYNLFPARSCHTLRLALRRHKLRRGQMKDFQCRDRCNPLEAG